MTLSKKIVWITGASSGIGEALVYDLVAQGATVIASSRNEEKLQQVKKNCGENESSCFIQILDMEQQDNYPELAEKIIKLYKKIDILLHVAGVSQRSSDEDISLETIRRIFEINFFGTVALTKAVLPYMKAQGYGHIAVTSSIVGKFGFPMRSAYSASKHALHGYFETLRAELHGKKISITIIIPGRVNTAISDNALTGKGKRWGKRDAGQAGGFPVEKTAKKILKSIRKKKKEVLVGGKDLIMVHLKRFFPGVFWKIVNRVSPT
ncbi:MAG: SDR family oxidoreductase [Bacteroidales bacterium]|nr:SDR family oxidoreductase [Bacteroidales bacterium]